MSLLSSNIPIRESRTLSTKTGAASTGPGYQSSVATDFAFSDRQAAMVLIGKDKSFDLSTDTLLRTEAMETLRGDDVERAFQLPVHEILNFYKEIEALPEGDIERYLQAKEDGKSDEERIRLGLIALQAKKGGIDLLQRLERLDPEQEDFARLSKSLQQTRKQAI